MTVEFFWLFRSSFRVHGRRGTLGCWDVGMEEVVLCNLVVVFVLSARTLKDGVGYR